MIAAVAPAFLTPQQLIDDSTVWLRGMGFPVEENREARVSTTYADQSAAWVIGDDDPAIYFAPRSYYDLSKLRPDGLRILLHEQLHFPRDLRFTTRIEEGLVEAVAWGLVPAYGRRVGMRARLDEADVAYRPYVQNWRGLSAMACGSRNWRTVCARRWLRDALRAERFERNMMIRQALIDRGRK